MKRLLATLTLLITTAVGGMAAAQDDAFETRARTVEVLLEANQRLAEESGGDQRKLMRQVQAQLAEAKKARDKGDEAKATALLDGAYNDLKRAIAAMASTRSAPVRNDAVDDPQSVQRQAKLAREYQGLTSSVAALGDAYQRIRAEEAPESADLAPAILVMRDEAEKLRQTGDLQRAHARMHHAYSLLRGAINEMRGGDTLIRSLNFASAEEEYRYEEERYENLSLVTQLLTAQKRENENVNRQVSRYTAEAAQQRKEAGEAASAGDYAAAVELMEAAAASLVKGVRSAGIYLP